MAPKLSAVVSLACASVVAASSWSNLPTNSSNSSAPYPPFSGNPFQKYSLQANGIRASFIPYGARITELLVKDKSNNWQDIVLGYDNTTQYLTDTETNHTYFGPVVGRYANRIKNGTFELDGKKYHISTNEHGGEDTLHGGFVGYDQYNWTVASQTTNSITFSFYDNAQGGFPGSLLNLATYTLTDEPALVSRLVSVPFDQATPIMLANHIYWNLDAFYADTILNQTLTMPYAKRIIDVDGILVPTGQINITKGTPYDFTTGKAIGRDFDQLVNSCGTGCKGYDNAFILDRPSSSYLLDPSLEVLTLESPITGIKMSLQSNQQGLQIYTCNGQNGSIGVKKSQEHGGKKFVNQYDCLVIETQDWIDGINHPEWGRADYEIFSPISEPYVNWQKYTFSVAK